MAKRPPAPKRGSVYAIQLSDGMYAFGQVCEGGDFAFFDFKSSAIPESAAIVDHAVAFRVPVAVDAPIAGGWQLVGSTPLHGFLAERGRYKHQPVGSPQVFIYSAGKSEPAAEREAERLEVLATWFSSHVVQRLEDHFAGRPNKYALSLERKR